MKGKQIEKVITGYQYQVAIDIEGNVYEWGSYIYKDGMFTNYPVPVLNNNLEGKIIDVSISEQHRIALDDKGKVYTWGDNYYGQLGDGTDQDNDIPVCISELDNHPLNGITIKEIYAGDYFSIALDDKGKVYTWGDNYYGQLGDGTYDNSYFPKCLNILTNNTLYNKTITTISAKGDAVMVIDDSDKIYTWGSGALGNGTYEDSNMPVCISEIQGNILNNKKIIEVSMGRQHAVALDNSGNVYVWGKADFWINNEDEESDDFLFVNEPICLSEDKTSRIYGVKIKKIFTGSVYTMLVDENGKLYILGAYIDRT